MGYQYWKMLAVKALRCLDHLVHDVQLTNDSEKKTSSLSQLTASLSSTLTTYATSVGPVQILARVFH